MTKYGPEVTKHGHKVPKRGNKSGLKVTQNEPEVTQSGPEVARIGWWSRLGDRRQAKASGRTWKVAAAALRLFRSRWYALRARRPL
eukprot:957491-Prorocentrum_minimum.AAC.1